MPNYEPHDVIQSFKWTPSAAPVRAPIVRVIDTLDREPPHVRLQAALATLDLFCEALGLCPYEALTQQRRMRRDIDGPFTKEWAAMADYARGELLT